MRTRCTGRSLDRHVAMAAESERQVPIQHDGLSLIAYDARRSRYIRRPASLNMIPLIPPTSRISASRRASIGRRRRSSP
jgi:hypothetical protein